MPDESKLPDSDQPKKDSTSSGKTLRNVAVLSGIGIEMGVIIYLAARGGMWLDNHYQTEKRLFTACCVLLGVGISLWVVLKQLRRFNT
ncbi:Putative F0F1-ATPase subunit Ca2+/Mg2+ transporter [Robiginitalea myxolifaciens]|uniref:Putative F0F1-ATPase subunit Ca2+/Mg2+ transporter n=1 Tax=Robiginitalea myxolifaciens TaxID=400055 RepID=A0A1I6G246_9FLAO|nr:AtpZ/AtpI family protein [Robiginitalea myxolifaciens]SFR36248.1 Putative F0F1-ATPase subunit Ca2+/Mg2+ transporter [Robiginitalea myxolifaciens]